MLALIPLTTMFRFFTVTRACVTSWSEKSMMGKKKLGTIRAEVREAFASAGIDPDRWFDEEIRKLRGRPSPDQGVIEALQKLRDALAARAADAPPKKKGRRVRSR